MNVFIKFEGMNSEDVWISINHIAALSCQRETAGDGHLTSIHIPGVDVLYTKEPLEEVMKRLRQG